MKRILFFVIALVLTVPFSLFSFKANADPTRPTVCGIPKDDQILPRNDIVLKWNDSPDEHHYYMTIRNLNTDTLIYNCYVLSQNTTSFTVPKSKLLHNTEYRWCVAAVDSNGVYKCAPAQLFNTEASYISTSSSPHQICKNDPHLYDKGYASTTRIDYFVYASSSFHSYLYDGLMEIAANSWNGKSANVTLLRTATPADGKYELGVYEYPSPADDPYIFGHTNPKVGGISGTIVSSFVTYDFAEVQTFPYNIHNFYNQNKHITNNFHITDCVTYLKANAMHEIGHALGMIHTDVNSYSIHQTKTSNQFVPLIMNQGRYLSSTITEADKSHLKLKWGG